MEQETGGTGGPRPSGPLLGLWRSLPIALRALLSGATVFLVLQGGWVAAFLANREVAPVVYRFIPVPETEQTDVSVFPWWSLYPTLIMLSINAGVSEEAGFRGYLQGGLEQRYGPVPAIAATSILFWLAHLNHPSGAARWALLIGYGVLLGALTWAARSIWPAIVTHATIDAVSFTTLASGFGPDYFMKKPKLFTETGVDPPFVVFSILLVASTAAGIGVLRRLRRGARAG